MSTGGQMIIVDRRRGIPPEQAEEWAKIGLRPFNAVLSTGGAGVISPSNPEGLVGLAVDLWLPPAMPPATVPQLMLAGIMVKAKELGGDVETLQFLAQQLFGVSFLEMHGMWMEMTAHKKPPDEKPNSHLVTVD